MQTIKSFLQKYAKLNSEQLNEVDFIMTTRYYKKNEIISFPDDIWTEYIFINRGIIRSYIINDEGKDFTKQFCFNTSQSKIGNLFAIDFESLLTGTPSYCGFEVLEDSEVTVFSKKNRDRLVNEAKAWQNLSNTMSNLAYLNTNEFADALLTKNVKQRYIELREDMSTIIDKIPQYHIATFLGITPVSLSRIRKELNIKTNTRY